MTWLQAAGSSGASGMSKEKLSKKVNEIRAAHVRKRMLCPSGYQTYDGLRGDIVSFSDLFSQVKLWLMSRLCCKTCCFAQLHGSTTFEQGCLDADQSMLSQLMFADGKNV